eukprot:359703-Pelagomonas_calceolata.AAC.1
MRAKTQWLIRYRISAIYRRETPTQGAPNGHFQPPLCLLLSFPDVRIVCKYYMNIDLEGKDNPRVD